MRNLAMTNLTTTTKRLAGHAGPLVQQGLRWAAFAGRHAAGIAAGVKALESVLFSSSATHGAFAVPSKLVGVRGHQDAIRGLKMQGYGFGTELAVLRDNGRLAVHLASDLERGGLYAERRLGYIQDKHRPWVELLLAEGLEVRLIGITGGREPGHLHGVNILFSGIEQALTRLEASERRAAR